MYRTRLALALAVVWMILLTAQTLPAQGVRARGQIFFPNGQPLAEVTRFILSSEDSRQPPEYYFTDSKGEFSLQGLATNRWYKITVETDDQTFATTEISFLAGPQAFVSVHLRPLDRPKARSGSATVSATHLGHQPPKEAAKAYDQALQGIQKRQYVQAKRDLRHAIDLDPGFTNAYNELAVLEMGERNYGEAEKLLRRAVETDSKSIHALLNLGIDLNHLQKYSEAIRPLRETLRLEPGLVAAHLHLGIALVENDEFDEAEKELTRAAKSTGADEALVQLYLGKLYARTGDFDKSISAFNAYLEKAPGAANSIEVRALIARMRNMKPKGS